MNGQNPILGVNNMNLNQGMNLQVSSASMNMPFAGQQQAQANVPNMQNANSIPDFLNNTNSNFMNNNSFNASGQRPDQQNMANNQSSNLLTNSSSAMTPNKKAALAKTIMEAQMRNQVIKAIDTE